MMMDAIYITANRGKRFCIQPAATDIGLAPSCYAVQRLRRGRAVTTAFVDTMADAMALVAYQAA